MTILEYLKSHQLTFLLYGVSDSASYSHSPKEIELFCDNIRKRVFYDGFTMIDVIEQRGVKHLFINKSGNILENPATNEIHKFTSASNFQNGIAKVGNEGKCNYITTEGKYIFGQQTSSQLVFNSGGEFYLDWTWVELHPRLYGYLHKSGKYIRKPSGEGWFKTNRADFFIFNSKYFFHIDDYYIDENYNKYKISEGKEYNLQDILVMPYGYIYLKMLGQKL